MMRRSEARLTVEPSLRWPISQLCTESQINSGAYAYWCSAIGESPRPHRKQWEYCYILQSLATRGVLAPEMRGVGFGVGEEPIVAAMAARGAYVLATDSSPETAELGGWAQTNQHARTKGDLNKRGLCPPDLFERLVQFDIADMNDFDLRPKVFDFVWSSCALEHLGSLRAGRDFISKSLKLLRPGGVAVHTTEYNMSNSGGTLKEGGTVLFRRRDLAITIAHARMLGYRVEINWRSGSGTLDHYIDVAPYSSDRHLKLKIAQYDVTSIGLLFEAPP